MSTDIDSLVLYLRGSYHAVFTGFRSRRCVHFICLVIFI